MLDDGPAITLHLGIACSSKWVTIERDTMDALPPVVGFSGYQINVLSGVVWPGPRLFVRVSRPRHFFLCQHIYLARVGRDRWADLTPVLEADDE